MTSRRFESVAAASVTWLARGAAALFLFVALALLKESLPALSHASLWGFLSGSDWLPTLTDPVLGILPMIAGTLAVSFGALVVVSGTETLLDSLEQPLCGRQRLRNRTALRVRLADVRRRTITPRGRGLRRVPRA